MSAFQAGRGTQPAPLSPRVGQNGTAGPASLGELGRTAGPPPRARADDGQVLFRERNPTNNHLSGGKRTLWIFLEWL